MGISQAQLAATLGLTQSAWSRVERGENALTADQLWVVASELGTTAAELLSEAESHAARLGQQGVTVERRRDPEKTGGSGWVWAAGAALGLLILAALAKGDD